MLKHLMSGASLISIALRAPDDEGKSDIQKARDAITAKVTVAAKEEKEEEKEDDNEDDENNEEIDEDDEEKEEEELEKELTAEEKEADRKSTRLNSSHQIISYAVFCLKKKKSE